MDRDTSYVMSVDRALQVLTVLGDIGPLGVTEAASRSGLSVSTTHRLLTTMARRGFTVLTTGRRYALGPAITSLASTRGAPNARTLIRPHLEEFFERTDETVRLIVRHGAHVQSVDGFESNQGLRVGLRLGSSVAARQSAGGRAMLADLDDDEALDLYLAGAPESVVRNKQHVLAELAMIRRTGTCYSDGVEQGVTAFGISLGVVGAEHVGITALVPSARTSDALRVTLFSELTSLKDRILAALHHHAR